MTVSSLARKAGPFAGNNLATTFPFGFKVFAKTDIKVLLVSPASVSTTLVLDSDYSVQLNANQDAQPGGWITYPISGVPLPANYDLVILGDLPYDQETDLTNTGGFYPQVVEDMSDRSTIQIQQLAEIASRAIVVSEAESGLSALPGPAARANMVIGFDALGNVATIPLPASVGAGDLKNEIWNAGTDYTKGTSTSVVVSRQYGTKANLGAVVMEGVTQDPDSYTLNGTSLQFNAPIPVDKVWCIGGTTLSTEIPPDGSVTDAKLSPSSNVAIIINTTPTLKKFGAKGDGARDDTTSILNAFASGELLIIGDAGDYIFNATIPVTLDGFTFRGRAGRRAVRFISQNANLPAFSVGDSLTGVELSSFTVSRTPAAVSGGDGVRWLGSNSQGSLSNIRVENCWRGFALGPTDYSRIEKCIAQQNYSYGFHVTNVGLGGPCQWSLDQCLAQNNNNHGLFIDASAGSSGALSLGEISQFSTFANTGMGIIALGKASNPINGLRILGGFIGGDADNEIYLDTYGGQHKIIGVECELAGFSATGRNNATPASNLGHGISITGNNERVQISDPNINGTSLSGIATFATATSISNPHITNCGIASVVSDRNGVLAGAGRTTIVGGYISDTGQGSQQYGVSVGAGAVVHVTGSDLTGNTVATTTGAGTVVTSNCLP